MFIFCMKIALILDSFFQAEIISGMEIIPMEVGTSATIACHHVKNDAQVRLVQWYKSRSTDVFEKGDDSLAWWRNGTTGSLPNYQIERDTFSLVISNTILEDEGLYKCSVVSGDLFEESNYYIRMATYILPRKGLVMTLEDDWNRVHCSMEHVKPLIYPVLDLEFDESYAVLNEDGTYSTSVCCQLPLHGKNRSRVGCSFSYLHHHQVESLSLRHTSTDKETPTMSTEATSVKFKDQMSTLVTSVTFADGGYRTKDRTEVTVIVVIMVLSIVANAILAVKAGMIRRKRREVPKSSKVKESEELTA